MDNAEALVVVTASGWYNLLRVQSLSLPLPSVPSTTDKGPTPTSRRRSYKQNRRSSSNSDSNEAPFMDFDWDTHLAYVASKKMLNSIEMILEIRSHRDSMTTPKTSWKTRIQALTNRTKQTPQCLMIPGWTTLIWMKVRNLKDCSTSL